MCFDNNARAKNITGLLCLVLPIGRSRIAPSAGLEPAPKDLNRSNPLLRHLALLTQGNKLNRTVYSGNEVSHSNDTCIFLSIAFCDAFLYQGNKHDRIEVQPK